MQFKMVCPSPLGDMLLASDGAALTGLWFVGQAYCGAGLPADAADAPELPVFELVQAWLESYFAGEMPKECAGAPAGPGLRPPAGELLRLELLGTPFQRMVWEALQRIPYGETTTYGKLAPRGWGGGGQESRLAHRAVSSRDGGGWLAHRICRRPLA